CRGLAVAAVADVARPAALSRLLQRSDDIAAAELGQRAAVQLDQVEAIGAQALEAALDAAEQGLGSPVAAAPAAPVPALGEEEELVPASADGLADQLFAVLVALRRVDDVQAGVERAAEEALDRAEARALVAHL